MIDTTTVAGLPDMIAKAENLPSPPAVAMEVIRLTGDEGVGIEDLAATISRDPVLAAKLLKLSNSSLFSRGDEVTTLDRATMMLGLKTVKLMALSFSLANSLPHGGDGKSAFDYDAYWTSSLTSAVAARSLAQLARNRLFDEAFMCGLLLRLGQLVMAETIPNNYREVCDHSPSGLPSADMEQRILGFDHHTIGAALLQQWEVPNLIHEVIRHVGDPDSFPSESEAERQFCYLLHMTGHATTVLCDSRKGPALRELHRLAHEQLGLPESEVDAFLVGLQNGIAETAALLSIDLESADSHEAVIQQARQQMVSISLGTAIDLQQTQDRAQQLEQEKQQLREKASTDKLTGIRNRAFFDDTLREVIKDRLAGKYSDSLGIIIMDVDHFKSFNDTYGHVVGDEVLKLVAKCIESSTRESDFAARYGGEEFVVLVPETTPAVLFQVAERIRKAVGEASLDSEGNCLSVTISMGGACTKNVKKQENGSALLKVADACLYEAKETGRNRSVCREVQDLTDG